MPTKVNVSGRLVWASAPTGPLDPVEVIDNKTKLPRVKADGTKMMERGFGLAVPKMVNGLPNAEFAAWWTAATAEAAKACNGAAPAWPNNRVFSYKLTDGDGKAPADIARNLPERDYPDHYKGCWVLSIKSQLLNAPPVYDGSSGQWLQVDPNNIRGNKLKVGDYVTVGLSIDGHLGESPGLYLNPEGIMFIGFGEPISRSADPTAMFGAAPGPNMQLPPGASATPVGPSAATPPVMPGAPPAAPVAPAAPQTPVMPGNASVPDAVPPVAPPAVPPATVAAPIASLGNAPLAPPVPGFAAGSPALPGMPATPAPAPTPPAAPPAPAAIPISGYDAATGKAWGVDPTTGQSVWLS